MWYGDGWILQTHAILFATGEMQCNDGSIGDDEDDNNFNLIPVQAGRHQDALSPSWRGWQGAEGSRGISCSATTHPEKKSVVPSSNHLVLMISSSSPSWVMIHDPPLHHDHHLHHDPHLQLFRRQMLILRHYFSDHLVRPVHEALSAAAVNFVFENRLKVGWEDVHDCVKT